MKEKTIFTISITITLLGILSLLYISEKIEAPFLEINEITKDYLEKQITTKGTIASIRETPGLYLITLKKETSEIILVIFKEDEELDLVQNENIQVTGKVEEYNGYLEVIVDEIRVI